jgi:hypothetical protein
VAVGVVVVVVVVRILYFLTAEWHNHPSLFILLLSLVDDFDVHGI